MNKYGENHFGSQIANRKFSDVAAAQHVMSNNKVSVIPTMEKVNYVDFLFSLLTKKATVVFLSTKSALLLGTLV